MKLDPRTLELVLGPKWAQSGVALALNKLAEIFLEEGSLRGVTALKTEQAIFEEFLLDSLAGCAVLPPKGTVIDIGTGGGVPGLILAVCRPDLDFILSDSASKKTRWVDELIVRLQLKNARTVTRRLELLGREEGYRDSADAVCAKALAPMNVLVELALPLVRPGGRLIAYKGPALQQELAEAEFALQELGGRVSRCQSYSIGQKSFSICEVIKVAPCPEKYPRRDGLPQKKPLLNSRKS